MDKLGTKVKGTIVGFDRIVFKGSIQPIAHSEGMMSFLVARKVLNKDFKAWAMAQSRLIVSSAEEISLRHCGCKVEWIGSLNTRKEELARTRQEERGVKEGLIGVFSCVESCSSFKSTFDPENTYPALKRESTKCKHLYYYLDHPAYGFMSVRLQTWAPYEIQIALNGREWLARLLGEAGCGYVKSGNKFFHIDDHGLAQELLYRQRTTDFKEVLDSFLPIVFPCKEEVLGPYLSYYWTFWQSEVAKDYLFYDSKELEELMGDFQLHALITGNGRSILKYFGSPVRKDGLPRHGSCPEVFSKTSSWYDGLRVRHWHNTNSLKLYNEHNVFRVEMTMNDPTQFMVWRHKQGQDKDGPKHYLKMRKGVADTAVRFDVSHDAIGRLTEHMSHIGEKTVRLGDVLFPVAKPPASSPRFRAIEAFGKDRELLGAVGNPANDVCAITNRQLQKALAETPWAKGMSGKRLSARISRHLRLLRAHGLIRKLPNQRKYALTDKGRRLGGAVDCALAASVNELLKLAA